MQGIIIIPVSKLTAIHNRRSLVEKVMEQDKWMQNFFKLFEFENEKEKKI